jgi:hypothetical protein
MLHIVYTSTFTSDMSAFVLVWRQDLCPGVQEIGVSSLCDSLLHISFFCKFCQPGGA